MCSLRNNFLIVIVACMISQLCTAQVGFIEIRGIVTDSGSNAPLDHASVYLSNTTIGTTTSEDGTFNLSNIPPGRYNLIISYLGFKTRVISIDERSNNYIFKIQLQQDVTRLRGIVVRAGKYNKTDLIEFERYFLGTDKNALNCTILNPEVLLFDHNEETGLFTANAKGILQIVNKALGYKIYYDLQYFRFDSIKKHLAYFGYLRFEVLHTKSKRIQRTWEKNRIETYLGSMRHFMKSLNLRNLTKEGFDVHKLEKIEDPYEKKIHSFLYKKILPYDSIIEQVSDKRGYVRLKFNNSLYITYTPPPSTGISYKIKTTVAPNVVETKPRYPPSILTLTTDTTYIDRNGVLTDPMAVIKEGGWANWQVADLLPFNYETLR